MSRAFFKLPIDLKRNYKFDLVRGYLLCVNWHKTRQADKLNSQVKVN